jgi:hypothetical protein
VYPTSHNAHVAHNTDWSGGGQEHKSGAIKLRHCNDAAA